MREKTARGSSCVLCACFSLFAPDAACALLLLRSGFGQVGVYIVRSGVDGGGVGGSGGGGATAYEVTRLSRAALRDGGAAYALRKLAEASAAAAASGAWPHAPLDVDVARAALKKSGSSKKADEEAAAGEGGAAAPPAESHDEL